eukprot:TRINITY_DN70330_c0_g1_i1.p1 TRINITY_DN70330_c0_g1~~TRINITY_DN70330_c0_g1_i1.p1  ORF type:complete len:426 (+),score=100.16 TRINITY_DN70330_c0_g1_i1:68-1279(+)
MSAALQGDSAAVGGGQCAWAPHDADGEGYPPEPPQRSASDQQLEPSTRRVTVVVGPSAHHFAVGLAHPSGLTAWLPCPPGTLPDELAHHATRLWGVVPSNPAAVPMVARVVPLDDGAPLETQVVPWDVLHAIPQRDPPGSGEGEPQRRVRRRRRGNSDPPPPSQYLGVVHVSGEAGWVGYHHGRTTVAAFRADVSSRWGVLDAAFVLARSSPLMPDVPLEDQCAHLEILHVLWDAPMRVPSSSSASSGQGSAGSPPATAATSPPLPPTQVPPVFRPSPVGNGKCGAAASAPHRRKAVALLLRMRCERWVQGSAFRCWTQWLRLRRERQAEKAPAAHSAPPPPSANPQAPPPQRPRGPSRKAAALRVAANCLASAAERLVRSRAFGKWRRFRRPGAPGAPRFPS